MRSSAEFEKFVHGSLPTLSRSAYALTGDAHLAQDLVQETHIRVARHWNRLTRDDEDVLPYARKVLYRLWLDSRRWRSRHPEHVTEEEPAVATSTDESELIVARLTVKSALMQLTPRQRAVVVLRFLEDRSEAEVAELLGQTVPTVHALVQRALAQLRIRYPELEFK
ncbi:SigE family RNA polymerase sigma factor [Knoellia sp. S7-12]|uniref:SigE family RNA polymerase sigma factor n=1 Tax=Knoellia sp. S7-12 TaxID=3126698 RepID=UPI003369B6B8